MSDPIGNLLSHLKQYPSHMTATWPNYVLAKELTELIAACEERDNLKVRVQELEIDVVDCNQLRAEAIEERDRYKADSEALDWLLDKFIMTTTEIVKARADCPEHLRKRLEGKK